MKYILPLLLMLSGCSMQQIDDAFTLPMNEYDGKWNPDLVWSLEDIHVHTNREMKEQADRRFIRYTEKYRNGTCLLAAEKKYQLALQFGYEESDLEIVVIKLTEDAALKADWSNGWPTHAVLRHKDEIFDNGFISSTPFYVDGLTRYGETIADVWSRYQK